MRDVFSSVGTCLYCGYRGNPNSWGLEPHPMEDLLEFEMRQLWQANHPPLSFGSFHAKRIFMNVTNYWVYLHKTAIVGKGTQQGIFIHLEYWCIFEHFLFWPWHWLCVNEYSRLLNEYSLNICGIYTWTPYYCLKKISKIDIRFRDHATDYISWKKMETAWSTKSISRSNPKMSSC